MYTTVYLIRHSVKMHEPKFLKNSDSFLTTNEKRCLSIIGEEKAKILSEWEELKNIDFVVSSNYGRSISTAKYICNENNKELYVDENFGERKVGINSLSELPNDYEYKQINDENYKLSNGESQKEVNNRMLNALNNLLNLHHGEKIVIVSHATAILFLFRTWCEINIEKEKSIIIYNGKEIFNNKFNSPEVFKLLFNDNNELIDIKNIKENEYANTSY